MYNKTLLAAAISVCLTLPGIVTAEEAAATPAAAPAAAPAAEATPAAPAAEAAATEAPDPAAMMQQMRAKMMATQKENKAIRARMKAIMAETDPAKREELIEANADAMEQLMRDRVALMDEMKTARAQAPTRMMPPPRRGGWGHGPGRMGPGYGPRGGYPRGPGGYQQMEQQRAAMEEQIAARRAAMEERMAGDRSEYESLLQQYKADMDKRMSEMTDKMDALMESQGASAPAAPTE